MFELSFDTYLCSQDPVANPRNHCFSEIIGANEQSHKYVSNDNSNNLLRSKVTSETIPTFNQPLHSVDSLLEFPHPYEPNQNNVFLFALQHDLPYYS